MNTKGLWKSAHLDTAVLVGETTGQYQKEQKCFIVMSSVVLIRPFNERVSRLKQSVEIILDAVENARDVR
jgi:hypothetical protein